jgi:CMP-N,N'-diacetyllegionaminic acid synthase
MSLDIVAIITARGGSKGIPQKNIKSVAGKPLIAWTIEAALQSDKLRRVIVSTDDEKIAQVALGLGAEVPFLRPDDLAQDTSTHVSVVEHALAWLSEHDHDDPGYILLLQPTSPLRTAQDIDRAVEIAESRQACAVVGVCEMHPHPYLSKRILEDGTLDDWIEGAKTISLRRQDLPPAYCINGAIYLVQREVFLSERTFFPRGGMAYVMPVERSLDIDTPWDLYLAELILSNKGFSN